MNVPVFSTTVICYYFSSLKDRVFKLRSGLVLGLPNLARLIGRPRFMPTVLVIVCRGYRFWNGVPCRLPDTYMRSVILILSLCTNRSTICVEAASSRVCIDSMPTALSVSATPDITSALHAEYSLLNVLSRL